MSNKGIIIDVGFAADIKDFINTVESEFKNVDFGNMIGLSDAFEEQTKDVRKQLAKLKDEIDLTINGSIKNDPTKQIQALNKAVGVLTSSFKEMVKLMPQSSTSKLTAGLDSIISDMEEMSNVCDNAADAVKKVNDVSKDGIKLTSKEQINDLKKIYTSFGEVLKIAEKVEKKIDKSPNTPYKNTSEVMNDLLAMYKEYMKFDKELSSIHNNIALTDEQKIINVDELNKKYAKMSIHLQRLFKTYKLLGGDLDLKYDFDGYKTSVKNAYSSIKDEYADIVDYIAKRQAEIQSSIYELGGSTVSDVVASTNAAMKNQKINVPLDISTKKSTLLNSALAIIQDVQYKVDENPLQVGVALVSSYKTKHNMEILEQVYGDLDNIKDDEIKNKLSKLLENLNHQIGNELHLRLEVEGSKEVEKTVKDLLINLRSQLEDTITITPDVKLTDEAKHKLKSDIDALSEGVTVNISIKDDAGEDTGVSSTKEEIKTISKLRSQIESVTQAIDNKSAAFQVEEQIVEGTTRREITCLQELTGWLSNIENTIKDISKLIVDLPEFTIEFNKDSLSGLNDLKDKGIFSSIFNDENGENRFEKELQELNDKAKITPTIDDSKFEEGIKNVKAILDTIPDEKEIKISVKDPYNAPLVTDENGKVKTFYRAKNGLMSHFVSKDIGTFYSDNYDVASTYGGSSGKIGQANLAMLNPLEIEGYGERWSEISSIGVAADKVRKKISELKKKIQSLKDAGKDVRSLTDELDYFNDILWQNHYSTDQIVELAKKLGYDGVIFKDIIDTMSANSNDPTSNVAVVFDQEQVKNASIIEEKLISIQDLLKSTSKQNLMKMADNIFKKSGYAFPSYDENLLSDYVDATFSQGIYDEIQLAPKDKKMSLKDIKRLYRKFFREAVSSFISDEDILDIDMQDELSELVRSFNENLDADALKEFSKLGIDLGKGSVKSDLEKQYDFEIKTNAEDVKSSISQLKDEINNLPDTKDIVINVKIPGMSSNEEFSAKIGQDKIDDFYELINKVKDFGFSPGNFFDGLYKGSIILNTELNELLKKLNLIKDDGSANFKRISNGNSNQGGMVSNDFTLIGRENHYNAKVDDLIPRLKQAEDLGANVGTIIGKIHDNVDDIFYEVQKTAKGKDFGFFTDNENLEYLNATEEQIQKLIEDIKILKQVGLAVDIGGDNILYDKEKGFSFIDLATDRGVNNPSYVSNDFDDIFNKYFRMGNFDSSWSTFEEKVRNIQKNGLSSSSSGKKGAFNVDVNVDPVVDAKDFANKVTQQLTGTSAEIEVKPIVLEPDNSNNNYEDIYNDLLKIRELNGSLNFFDLTDFKNKQLLIKEISDKYDLSGKGISIDSDTSEDKLKNMAKQLADIKDSSRDIFVNIDESKLIGSVNTVIKEIDRIPDKKDVLINIKTTDYSDIEDLSDKQGKTIKFYRGVDNVYGGMFSNTRYGGTFASNSLEVAKSYAGDIGKVYEQTVRFKNALELDAKGSDWSSILNLGSVTDKTAKLSKTIKKYYMEIKNAEKGISNIIDSSFADNKTKESLHYYLKELTTNNMNEEFTFDTGISSWTNEFEWFLEQLTDAGLKSESLNKLLEKLKDNVREFKKISDDPSNMYGMHTTDEYLKYAIKNGNDGIIVRNVYDDVDAGNIISDVVAPIYENQIHNVKVVKDFAEEASKELSNHEANLPIKISDDSKKEMLGDIKKISDELNNIFETTGIDNWSSKFINSLIEISHKIETLFGNNALTDMLNKLDFSSVGNVGSGEKPLLTDPDSDNVIKWYRTVSDSITGLFSTRDGSFASDSLRLSKGYASDARAKGVSSKTYEETIRLTDKILEITESKGKYWLDLSYTGDGSDGLSKEIKALYKLVSESQEVFDKLNDDFRNSDKYDDEERIDLYHLQSGFIKSFKHYNEAKKYSDEELLGRINELYLLYGNDDPYNDIFEMYDNQQIADMFDLKYYKDEPINNMDTMVKLSEKNLAFLKEALNRGLNIDNFKTDQFYYYLDFIEEFLSKDNIGYINSVFDAVDRIREINSDKSVLYGATLPSHLRDYTKPLDPNNNDDYLTTNNLTSKAKNNGFDAVIFREISDSATFAEGEILSNIISVINNKIVESARVLSDEELLSDGNIVLNELNKNITPLQDIINNRIKDLFEGVKTSDENFNKFMESDEVIGIDNVKNVIMDLISKYQNGDLQEILSNDHKDYTHGLFNNIYARSTHYDPGQLEDGVWSSIQENIPKFIHNILTDVFDDTLKKYNSANIKSEPEKVKVEGSTASSFTKEDRAVNNIVNGEIKKLSELEQKLREIVQAVNAKTDAFKEEGKVVGEIVDKEIKSLDPLNNLESSFNNFKKFYDNNDLESEAGSQAALSYYNAYKESLTSKVNKKDLQPFTLGKMDDLFTGNYANYKKGVGELDLSGLNSQITKYQEIVDKFNQPEVISIINALREAIEKLLATGNSSAEATALLKNLNNVINNLGGKNSAEKIAKVATNLENFQKSIQALDISDSGFVKSLSSILEKGEELKALGEVLKSTKKQIDAAGNAISQQDKLSVAQDLLRDNEENISKSVNEYFANQGKNIILQSLEATKEGFIEVTAVIEESENAYKRFIFTTTNGTDLKLNKNANATLSEVKQIEAFKKMQQAVPHKYIGGSGGKDVFTPDHANWDQLVSLAQEFGIELEDIRKIIRTVDREGSESFQIFTKLSRITVGMDSDNVLFQKDEVLDADKAIKNFENDVESLKKSLFNSFKDDMGTEKFLKTLKNISNTWEELIFLKEKGLISDEELSEEFNYFNAFKTSLYSFSLDKVSVDNKTPQFVEQFKQAEDQLNYVKIALDKVSSGEVFTAEDFANIKEFISQMRTLYEIVGDKENKLGKQITIDKTLKKIYKTMNQNSAMSKELKQRFVELAYEMMSFGENMPQDQLDKFVARYENLLMELEKSGKTGLSFFDGIWKRAKSMSQSFISMYLSLYDIIRYIRTGLTYIKELDTAFTEMRKVSDESVESLRRFQSASFDIASAVGTTAQQIQNSTADWMRLGESLNEASKSAEASNILLNVSEFESIDEATESLVSMSAAYDELEKMDIIDKLNQVGNNFSISTDGLATALQRSASALKTAGNDMDEAVALVTAGNAVVQNPDSVGAGLRTIALRITGTEAAKEELESLGEDTSDFIVQTSAKSQQAIKDFTRVASNDFQGFDILDDNGNFKSTYDILLGIADIYDEIVETDKQYGSNMANGLLETLAGKNRANIAASILQNPQLLKDVYTSSQDSEGSAQKELDKYLDSIEGKIAQFKNEVQEFWYNLISSETIKFFIDAGTKIVDVIGNIVGALGEVGTVLTATGVFFGGKALIQNSGGRVKMFTLIIKYATESFSREVCEFWCTLEW